MSAWTAEEWAGAAERASDAATNRETDEGYGPYMVALYAAQLGALLAERLPGPKPQWGQGERPDTVNALRDLCARFGDNDWPDDLHLGDVIEKHLDRHLPERLTDAQLDGLTDEELAAALERAGGLPAPKGAGSAADALTARGVFKGAHGLKGLLEARDFWDKQPYGTRLYYGDGIADYLHIDVLHTAVRALEEEPSPSAVPTGAAWDLVAALESERCVEVPGNEADEIYNTGIRDSVAIVRAWLAGAPEPTR